MPRAALGVIAVLVLATVPAAAGPLETLERERALLIATLLDPALDPDARQARVEPAMRRLADLERIVLRDPRGVADTSAHARQAFADYELSFIAHASIERGIGPLDLWLERLGVTSDRLAAARVGRR